MAEKKFQIKYTATAFEQDSGLAMKNDIVRALIELLTNADDAYARAVREGKIEIIVRRSKNKSQPVEITVRDQATGLDRAGMESSFIVLGGDKSGFAEGQDVRGLFSRGSKDTAWFGSTVFESIKDGEYTRLELRRDGTGVVDSVPAEKHHYETLGLSEGGCGLSATMVVSRRDTQVPELRRLVERLSSHVQLRDVVSVQDVTIAEYVDGELFQALPVVWEEPASTELFDGVIDVPGYDAQAHLTLVQLAERSEGPVRDDSQHGIVVRGSRAAYMNTMFGQSGGSTHVVHGVLTCPMIDELIRAFGREDQEDERNPMRLVSRSRDGLEETHPFMRALTAAVLQTLKPILEALEPKSKEAGSPELRRDLTALSQLLAEEMKSDLDDEDDNGVGDNLPTAANPIIVIPPVLKARLGSKRTLTVLVYEGSAAASGIQAAVSSGIFCTIGTPTSLVKHPVFAETLVCQVRLEMLQIGSTTVVVSAVSDPKVNGSSTIVIDDFEPEETEPTELEWKNTTMSVTTGKTRSLLLRAPIELAPSGELEAVVTLESENIRLEDDRVTLRLTSRGWLEGRVKVTGITHSATQSRIVATAGGEVAEGVVRTTLPNPTHGLNIEIELVDRFAGPTRGEIVTTDAGLKLVMYGRHRGLSDRLGPLKADGSYTRENELDTLAVFAEVIASVAGDHVLRNKVTKDPAVYRDIDNIVFERTKVVDRYLRILLEGIRDVLGK